MGGLPIYSTYVLLLTLNLQPCLDTIRHGKSLFRANPLTISRMLEANTTTSKGKPKIYVKSRLIIMTQITRLADGVILDGQTIKLMRTMGLITIILKSMRHIFSSNTTTDINPIMDSRHTLLGMVARVMGIVQKLYIPLVVFTIHLLTISTLFLTMESHHELSLTSATSHQLETLSHALHHLHTSQTPCLHQRTKNTHLVNFSF